MTGCDDWPAADMPFWLEETCAHCVCRHARRVNAELRGRTAINVTLQLRWYSCVFGVSPQSKPRQCEQETRHIV